MAPDAWNCGRAFCAFIMWDYVYARKPPARLFVHGQADRAKEILSKLRKSKQEVEEEISDIQQAESEEKGGFKELFEPWVRPALIGVGLAFLQQFIGTNTIIYYAPKTFTSVGFGNSAAILGTVGIGAVNVVMTFVAIKIIDRVGRKALLLFGNAGMVLSLIVLSVVNRFFEGSTAAGWTTIICLGLFIVIFAVRRGPVVWVMLPELFPVHVRGIGTGVSTFLLHTGNLIISLTFPTLLSAMGISNLFLIYAVIGVGAFLFVKYMVAETKGKSLEEIEEDLKKRNRAVTGEEGKTV